MTDSPTSQQLNQAGASAVPRPAMSVPPVPPVPRNAFEGIQSATILKPGDRVLLLVDHMPSHAEWERMRVALKRGFPDAEFLLVSGVEDVVVKPAEEPSE